MARLSFHASQEQFAPGRLLRLTEQAESAGFDAFFSSDHFHPWTEKDAQAGFSWCWMGAALARTRLPGGLICCAGYRYHPAMVAQAAATLGEMFPGRLWLALGSGEALNERITGLPWPAKEQRNELMRESAEIIRALWRGEMVTHRGLVQVHEAKLYTLPEKPPLLVGAALCEATAKWLGGWADGLLTTSRPPAETRRIIEAFYRGGGEGKPLFLKVGLAYAETEQAARKGAHEQWRTVTLPGGMLAEMRNPWELDAAGRRVPLEKMDGSLRISASLAQHQDWLAADLEFGFEEVILHNIHPDQERFVEDFGSGVLGALRGRESPVLNSAPL